MARTRARRAPDRRLELGFEGTVCGVDEVGYSPLAGPIVAAAVVLPRGRRPRRLAGLRDSKQLTAEQRERFYPIIRAVADVGVGSASVAEIDGHNVYRANHLAMARAVAGLERVPDVALVDGRARPDLGCSVEAVVRGDERCLSIAAASIVAKVTRDRVMRSLAAGFPGYGWQTNVGYGTDAHYLGLLRLGPSPHHRRSFAPIRTWFGAEPGPVAPWRFEPGAVVHDVASLEILRLRQDLYAVFDATRIHAGLIKNGRGGWRLRAIGYERNGIAVPGDGPLSPWHDRPLESPCRDGLRALIGNP